MPLHYTLGAGRGAFGWHWLLVEVLWATGGGIAIGAPLRTGLGRLVLHMRHRHQAAWPSQHVDCWWG